MWSLILMSFLSTARADDAPLLTITLTDPTGAEHLIEGSAPLEGEQRLDLGKAAQRFVVRATHGDSGVRIIGELHEVKGSKDKIVRYATIVLPSEGSNRAERLSWGAPRGATVPDGLNPDLLAWRVVGQWEKPAPPEPAPEVPREAAPESPEEAPAEAGAQ